MYKRQAEYRVRDLPAQGLRRRYRMGVRSAVEACPFKDKRRSKARGTYMHIPPAAQKYDSARRFARCYRAPVSYTHLDVYKRQTQSRTAELLGMSQVQVSRREKAVLALLRRNLSA